MSVVDLAPRVGGEFVPSIGVVDRAPLVGVVVKKDGTKYLVWCVFDLDATHTRVDMVRTAPQTCQLSTRDRFWTNTQILQVIFWQQTNVAHRLTVAAFTVLVGEACCTENEAGVVMKGKCSGRGFLHTDVCTPCSLDTEIHISCFSILR